MAAPGQADAYLKPVPVTVLGVVIRPGDRVLVQRHRYRGKEGKYLGRFREILLIDTDGERSPLYCFLNEIRPIQKNQETSAGRSHLVSR